MKEIKKDDIIEDKDELEEEEKEQIPFNDKEFRNPEKDMKELVEKWGLLTENSSIIQELKASAGSESASLHSFKTITGITNDVVADKEEDILTLGVYTGSNILKIIGNPSSDKITFNLDETKINHDNLTNFTTTEHFTMLDEDDMATDSNTQASTQQSIKAYVDGKVKFRDDFDDASVLWVWREHNVAAGKTITEASGLLTIAVTDTTDAIWSSTTNNAPKVITGIRGCPCEIICKLNSYTVNDDTQAGMFVGLNAAGTGSAASICYGRQRDDTVSLNGLNVFGMDGSLSANAITTLPIWLRVRITGLGGLYGGRAIFAYSTDGSSWTTQYTHDTYDTDQRYHYTGLFVRNWGVKNAISTPFEYFEMREESNYP